MIRKPDMESIKERMDDMVIKVLEPTLSFVHGKVDKAYDRQIARLTRKIELEKAELRSIREQFADLQDEPIDFSLTDAGRLEVLKTLDIAMKPFQVDSNGVVTR
jgi:hypothetical protein